jgi:hypothetical protein
MPGNSYQIERVNWEGQRGNGKKTYAYSVYPLSTVDHHYEVARWQGGIVKDTAIVTYDARTCAFDCTCKNHREPLRQATNKRGYCDHVDNLTKHYLRKLPTLEAPARVIEASYKEKRPWTSSTSTPVPSAHEPISTSRKWTNLNLAAARTVSRTYMPATVTPSAHGR